MAARLLVLALALAAIGFLAVQERGARAADRLTGLALSRPDVRQAEALERTARRLSPDTAPSLDLGIVESRAGRYRTAGARFAAVAREEPENVRAWTLLCLVAPRYDSDSAATACARARALAPPVPPAR
jgi:Flp pilus assembly protein TadD